MLFSQDNRHSALEPSCHPRSKQVSDNPRMLGALAGLTYLGENGNILTSSCISQTSWTDSRLGR